MDSRQAELHVICQPARAGRAGRHLPTTTQIRRRERRYAVYDCMPVYKKQIRASRNNDSFLFPVSIGASYAFKRICIHHDVELWISIYMYERGVDNRAPAKLSPRA